MPKHSDHQQKLYSLMVAFSGFTGMVFILDSTKQMVIFKIFTVILPSPAHHLSQKNGLQ